MSMFQRSLTGAALILALAVLRAVLGGVLPRRATAALWWAAVLRLLLPWEIPCRFSVYNLLAAKPQAAAPLPPGGDIAVRLLPGAAAMTPAAPAAPKAAEPLLPEISPWAVIWLAGAVLLAVWFIAAYLRCRRKFRTSLPAEGAPALQWQTEHPGISLRVSDRITGPLTYGLLRPVILLPKGLDPENRRALGHILTHEYEHIRHLDGLTKLVLAGTLCVHWWNPAVWLMAVLANRDLELACDEAVVRRTGDPAAYARTLLAMEEARAGLCPQFAQSPIEERIKAMIRFQNKRVPTLAAAAALLLVLCVTTAFATSARGPEKSPAEQLRESIACGNGTLAFTVPEADVKWDLRISGRVQAGGMGMSVHYLEEESEAGAWKPGETYQFRLSEAAYEELSISGLAGKETVDIDLLPYLPHPAADVDSGIGMIQGEVLARGGKDGEKFYSVDGGETWLSEERYQAQYGAWGEDWQVEWWTAEEYEKWLEQEKKELQDIIGSQGWTPSTGWFTWDQKKVDEAVAQYEKILEEIRAGVLHSKRILDKNGQEVPDIALGSGTALGTTVIASFDKSTAGTPEAADPAELLKALEKYGVTGSEKAGLTYKGRPVRTLADGAAVEGGWSVRYVYRNDKGTVDLHTLRARKDNGDGSYDPMGELTGVAAKGDLGFDQGLIDSCSITGAVTTVTEETGTAESKDGSAEDGQQAPIRAEAAAADGSDVDEGTPLPEMFDKYKPFGLEYRETRTADGVRRNLFYQGKPVNHLEDIHNGGVFSFGSSDQSPEGLYVWTCYKPDGELSKLITLASVVLSEKEAAKPIERNTLVNGDFPKNSRGETYGNYFMSQVLGRDPDLVAATGTEGQLGYVRNSDISEPDFKTPEEIGEWLKTQPQAPYTIPLYDFQGNEIGEFEISGSGKLPEGISLEEAKKLVAAGGTGA